MKCPECGGGLFLPLSPDEVRRNFATDAETKVCRDCGHCERYTTTTSEELRKQYVERWGPM